MNKAKIKYVLKWVMGLIYIVAGINHFIKPEFYKQLMPSYLPFHYELIALSGGIEILLGIGLLFSKTTSWSAWGIIVLLIAVFPANIYMWTNHIQIDGHPTPILFHYIRLPMQFLLIYCAFLYTKTDFK
ncbi:MAG: hypothetical protein Q7U04_14360 [Bacteriovorax sp.]|nr:hypothetical protein [Bacteriovorax sp.]